jgi:hypothetical protein
LPLVDLISHHHFNVLHLLAVCAVRTLAAGIPVSSSTLPRWSKRLCGPWRALFLAVDDHCTLAHSMPAEQEPSTSSAKGRVASIKALGV